MEQQRESNYNDEEIVRMCNIASHKIGLMNEDEKEKIFIKFFKFLFLSQHNRSPFQQNTRNLEERFQRFILDKTVLENYRKPWNSKFGKNTKYYYRNWLGLTWYIQDLGSLLPLFPILNEDTVVIRVKDKDLLTVEQLNAEHLKNIRSDINILSEIAPELFQGPFD